MASVSQTWFTGQTLFVKTDDAATSIEVRQVGSELVVRDVGASRTWSFAAARVGTVEFQGGAGNDRFVNKMTMLPIRAFGFGGNDHLEGYHAADVFVGGDGDDTLVGYGGDDQFWGGTGNDVILGGNGADQLMGEGGDDQLNGGAGTDRLWGGIGNDVLVTIDSGTSDSVNGGTGTDTFWCDLNGSPTSIAGESRDTVADVSTGDVVQSVSSFTNGADRTLDGDRIADPTVEPGYEYRAFAGNPLFSRSGPSMEDLRQGTVGNCYFLAGLGSIAADSPAVLRQRIVDFNDGTYGVRLGDSVYRVDNDLPVHKGFTRAAFAGLGRFNSMWVAIAEKAFAHHRRGENSYASIEAGMPDEANRAFGSTTAGSRGFGSYGSAAALANDLANRWKDRQSVSLAFLGGPEKGHVILNHAYSMHSAVRSATGVVTAIVVRNPWGVDGSPGQGDSSDPFDGLVTLTPEQIRQYGGKVCWGRV